MRITLVISIASTLLLALTSWLLASVSFTPPNSNQSMLMSSIPLMAQAAAPQASGTMAVVSDKAQKKCDITLQARSLDPKKVYTAWFVKTTKSAGKVTKKMQGVGKAPYALKVDSKGYAQVMATGLDCKTLLAWQTVEVYQHPDKNPKSMKGVVPVLIGDVSKLVQ